MEKRIDLTQFENISSEGWEYLSDESRDINDAALDKIPDLIAELKRLYKLEKIVIDFEHECHFCDEAGGLANICEYDYRCQLVDHFTCVCGECGYRHDRFEPCKYCASE